MGTDLQTVGALRDIIAQQAGVNVAGGNAVTADLPNGPLAGRVWIVDSAHLIYASIAGGDAGAVYLPPGISIIPVGTNPVNDTANSIDTQDRGIIVVNGFSSFASGAYDTQDLSLVGVKPVIPYGYTLRAFLATDPSVGVPPVGTLFLRAIIRDIPLPC